MKYIILVVMALAVWHLVYEAILLPSFRLSLRFRLFKLRDELRWLRVRHPTEVPEEVFQLLQGRVNTGLKLLPFMDIPMLRLVYETVHTDRQLKERIEERDRIISACSVPEVQRTVAVIERHQP